MSVRRRQVEIQNDVEALKDTAEVMIEDGIGGEVSWRTLLGLVQQGEKMQSVDGASKNV